MKKLYRLRVAFNILLAVQIFAIFTHWMLRTQAAAWLQIFSILACGAVFWRFMSARECKNCHCAFPYKAIENIDKPLICPYCHNSFE